MNVRTEHYTVASVGYLIDWVDITYDGLGCRRNGPGKDNPEFALAPFGRFF